MAIEQSTRPISECEARVIKQMFAERQPLAAIVAWCRTEAILVREVLAHG